MTVKITYFVHGTTTDNEQDLASGWKDVDLSDLGVQQSVGLRNQINVESFDRIYCSDLKRAVHSTKITFQDIPFIVDQRLRECNYGDLNGKSTKEVEQIELDCIDNPFPNGESYRSVEGRILDFLDSLRKHQAEKHIAIIAHKAPQLALDVILKGRTWEQAFADDWRKTKSWQPGWEYEVK